MSHPTLRLFDGTEDTSPELQNDVRELQSDLNAYGFNLTVDGVFGSDTEASVHQFQLDHGLLPDGIVGARTWAALTGAAPPDPVKEFFTTIPGSDAEMRSHYAAAEKFKSFIDAGAKLIGVPSVVIAGLGSRESGWGLNLRPPEPSGTGDFHKRRFPTAFRSGPMPPHGGYGRGLMQIDFDAFAFARTGHWKDPEANISFGCNVLKGDLDLLQEKTALTGRRLLQAAVAAYNCGAGNVLTTVRDGYDLDFFTTGRNYSVDVFNRAGFFQNAGWESDVPRAAARAGG